MVASIFRILFQHDLCQFWVHTCLLCLSKPRKFSRCRNSPGDIAGRWFRCIMHWDHIHIYPEFESFSSQQGRLLAGIPAKNTYWKLFTELCFLGQLQVLPLVFNGCVGEDESNSSFCTHINLHMVSSVWSVHLRVCKLWTEGAFKEIRGIPSSVKSVDINIIEHNARTNKTKQTSYILHWALWHPGNAYC